MEKRTLRPVDDRGFARAVSVSEPTHERVFVSGAIAVDREGTLVGAGDMAAQTRYVYERIEEYLGELGGSMDDLLRVRVYVTTMEDDAVDGYREGRADFYGDPEHYPASTLVEIDSLVRDGAMVEVDAEAIIPDDDWSATVQR
jgi:enamine deaminase RidA (YjgF/YER057c/UK114 family)